MSSTFSTNLALELIGTGDQAGAWGNTTNTNLGTLIEQAISGYVTQAVVTGTDTTLTIPNGATGVARNMYIELTGTGGTNTNLIVPANKKLYFIYNNSTGAVTVKVLGQTGVSVPTGKKMLLVSNGTDIVNGLNYIADFGTNSFTVTNLTATSATITTLTSPSANITTLTGTTLGYTSASLTNLAVTSLTVSSLSLSNATFTSATITTLKSTSATIDNLSSTSANVTTLTGTTAGYSSANITTLSGTNFSATSLTLTNALKIAQGGTGQTSTPTNGQLLIGNGTGFTLNTLNGGPGVGITNAAGSITITATGTGFIASVNATSPLQSVGTDSITISIASSTGSGAVVLASGAQFSATSANITTLTGTSATITNILDGAGNVRKIPSAGSTKTSLYTLATTDVGEFVTVGSGGSIDVPNDTFSAGDAVSIFNNTAGNVTISLTITTAYLSGTDSDKASVTLATRGVATVLFINPSLCVLTGALS